MSADSYCLQRQTKAKHDLLKNYLPAWSRVLSEAGHPKLLYVDGFSFTGQYTSDEDGGEGGPGSPLIALKCFTGDGEPSACGQFVFVEESPSYVEELKGNIDRWPHRRSKDSVQCLCGRFEDEILPTLSELEQCNDEACRGKYPVGSQAWMDLIVPAFVFIDPYGATGFPMELVRRILALPRTEVFINLMWVRTAFNLKNPDHQAKGVFTKVFGNDEWKHIAALSGDDLRRAYLELYMKRLRAPDGAGASIVRHFEMRSSDGKFAYWMVFATNNRVGWRKMKEAMWGVDPGGGFAYYDTTASGQEVLFEKTPNLLLLRRMLGERFGRRADVPFAEIEEFVLMDTPYLPNRHLKRGTLVPMEKEGTISVKRPDGKRGGSFPQGCVVDFTGTGSQPMLI